MAFQWSILGLKWNVTSWNVKDSKADINGYK